MFISNFFCFTLKNNNVTIEKMRVFITGSTGLLGSALLRYAPKNVILAASYNKNRLVPNVKCEYFHADITQKDQVDKALSTFKPDIVIHTAAIATPDYCDKHQEEANLVNVQGTKNIIDSCRKNNASFVYITTNGVYDGENAPYDESSEPQPIDIYGKTKFEGEKLTQSSGLDYILIRLITMYGWNNPNERQNPLSWLVEILGKNKTPVNMVTDMYNNFLSAKSAADSIWKAVELKKFGETFNIAGKDCISRYEFSKEIAQVFDLDGTMIYPVTLDFFKNFVPRPKNTCFITTKMEKELAMQPLSTKEGLAFFKTHPLGESAWKEI